MPNPIESMPVPRIQRIFMNMAVDIGEEPDHFVNKQFRLRGFQLGVHRDRPRIGKQVACR
jgi:hypothetical protein